MELVVSIQHPADVHFFKHAIGELTHGGHSVSVFVRENEVAADLLSVYGIDHEVLVDEPTSLASLALTQLSYTTRLLRRVRPLDPDVIAAVGGVTASHVATAVGARSVVFTDTEHATLINTLATPFADVVCTPDCFSHDVGEKQLRYPGYQELAYLHPDRFSPDPDRLDDLAFAPEDRLVVCRIGAWNSSHDVGQGGFSGVREVVRALERTGACVALSSEVPLSSDLERRRTAVEPHRIHDLLARADCYIGEGASMAAESAVLGTPAVYVNSLTMGYTDELEWKHGLLFNYQGRRRHERALDRAVSILELEDDDRWRSRRDRLLDSAQDVTEVVVDVVLGRDPGRERRRTDDLVCA